MKVTIKDLAKKAGVSKTAVSFAFNSPERISKETYKRIMRIAKEIGYSPDPLARILATRQTRTLGFLLPQTIEEVFRNPYISEIVRGMGYVCEHHSMALTILSPQKGIITHSIQNAVVDGMIVMGVDSDSEVHAAFSQRKMPYVTIDAEHSKNYLNVGIDDETAAKSLMDLLLDLGHRKICICALLPISQDLSAEDSSTTMSARRNGIMKSVQQHNLKNEVNTMFSFVETEVSLSHSYNIARQELSKKNRPTAIFCMGDAQAFGFYRAAQELDISIPDELSIVSFDDLPINKVLYPELTAIHQPGFTKGKTAAELLIEKINGKKCESIIIPSYIENRASAAPAEVR